MVFFVLQQFTMSKHLISVIRVLLLVFRCTENSRNPFQYNEHSTNQHHHNTILLCFISLMCWLNVLNGTHRIEDWMEDKAKRRWTQRESETNAQQAARKLFKKFNCGAVQSYWAQEQQQKHYSATSFFVLWFNKQALKAHNAEIVQCAKKSMYNK